MENDLKKDPYLSELDAMDTFEPPPPELVDGGAEETVHDPAPPEEDATRFDVKVETPKAAEITDFGMDAPAEETPEMLDMETAVEPEGPPPVKELLDLSPDLTVPLVIVMGRKSFTVKDLLALRIGQVMDLERSPTEPVDLVAAGKVVGKGELVEVDGKLGIRVLKLLK